MHGQFQFIVIVIVSRGSARRGFMPRAGPSLPGVNALAGQFQVVPSAQDGKHLEAAREPPMKCCCLLLLCLYWLLPLADGLRLNP